MTQPESSLTRFTSRAEDYARYRPSYAPGAIDAVLEGLGDPSGLTAADVGAGTGISARLLGDRGVRVFAVEPNAAMRREGGEHPRVTWVDGTAEATGLHDASVDLVLVAQAFHWFRPDESLAEFARVLRPGGRLALVWNDRDDTDPFSRAYYDAVLSTPEAQRVSGGWGRSNPLDGRGGWAGVRESSWSNPQRTDARGVIGRAMSASYVPKSGLDHDRIVAALEAACRTHAEPDGSLTLRYRTKVYLAEKAG